MQPILAITAGYEYNGLGQVVRIDNAHGDVVQLANASGTVTKTYDYDAFGNEISGSATDANPLRYCGEYFDTETGTYYLRARYYDPTIGRFTQQDTHWSTTNSIYGDNAQVAASAQDALGLTTYTYVPQISAVMQSGNLYVYAMNNPVTYCDRTGEFVSTVVGTLVGFVLGGLGPGQNGSIGFNLDKAWAGAANGFISGLSVDIGVAIGGVVGIVVVAIGGAGGAIWENTLTTDYSQMSFQEIAGSIALDAGLGIAFNLLSFGLADGSLVKAKGKWQKNVVSNAKKTLLNETTKTVGIKSVDEGTKILGTVANKVIVRKSAPAVAKRVAANIAYEVATASITNKGSWAFKETIKGVYMA